MDSNVQRITSEELIKLLKEYDFISNSVNSFCKKYGFWGLTIRSYLNKYEIPYNKRKQKIFRLRDEYGRFSLTYTIGTSIENAQQVADNQKRTNIENIPVIKSKHSHKTSSKKCKTFSEMAAKQY